MNEDEQIEIEITEPDREAARVRLLADILSERYEHDNMPIITDKAARKAIENKIIEMIQRW